MNDKTAAPRPSIPPAANGLHDIQALAFELRKSTWSSLAIVAADDRVPVTSLAERLVAAMAPLLDKRVVIVDAVPGTLDTRTDNGPYDALTIRAGLSDAEKMNVFVPNAARVIQDRNRAGELTVVAVRNPAEDVAAISLLQVVDAGIVAVRVGSTSLGVTRSALPFFRDGAFLGGVLLDTTEAPA